MKCPICGHNELNMATADYPYTYKDKTITIKNVAGQHCSACGETILSGEDLQRVSDESMALNKRVNAEIIDPHFIIGVRKKLKLTQKEASQIFGGGPNAFSRYETGKTLPPQSLIQLLRLLDSHPNLFSEVKNFPADKICSSNLAYA
ncbi:MAG: type II toxin-antitoxin system MqsA family antitoxin [Deltaproteobacteria bacterium]|jgi:HTH-type transcriptional regulator/antitoxin MqsA|nr:type II toxin-antitoxin system MqsA family antitoxin [Deltaproteobacteria bacterium]